MEKHSLHKGVNLGGWLSQYKEYDPQHFNEFITRDDIQRIADWGFDHIRLPVDYPVLESDSQPGKLIVSGLNYLFDCLNWCEQAHLRVILDLHKAPGYAFDDQKFNQLEQNTVFQDRLIHLWSEICGTFQSIDEDLLAFELLNEVFFTSSALWNDIAQRILRAIRQIDSQRLILLGGNYFYSVDYLSELVRLDDPQLLYKFHYYLPSSVTHQKAYWFDGLYEFDRQVNYPGEAFGLKEFLEKNPQFKERLNEDVGQYFDRSYLLQRLQPAIAFSRSLDQPLHCGEFGVIDKANRQTRLNWARDMVSLFNEYDFGYAYWSYKAMDFGLVDQQGNILDQELIDILVGR